jgi:hypothetical protein
MTNTLSAVTAIHELCENFTGQKINAYTPLEFELMDFLECEDIEDTRETIAQAVTEHRRLNDKEFMQEHINYFIKTVYPQKWGITDATAEEVMKCVKDDIYMSVYDDKFYDDYSTMAEDEIRNVIYNAKE